MMSPMIRDMSGTRTEEIHVTSCFCFCFVECQQEEVKFAFLTNNMFIRIDHPEHLFFSSFSTQTTATK